MKVAVRQSAEVSTCNRNSVEASADFEDTPYRRELDRVELVPCI